LLYASALEAQLVGELHVINTVFWTVLHVLNLVRFENDVGECGFSTAEKTLTFFCPTPTFSLCSLWVLLIPSFLWYL